MGRKYYLDPETGEKIYIKTKIPSLGQYRKSADQDVIDSSKVDKVTGKSLSTNDYDNVAKAKVDAIPSNPKYTDTVYDDTEVRTQISGKLTEPESGIVAGKYFKVKSVDEDGHAVLEAVDLPIAVPGGDDGLAKYYQTDYYGITKSSNGCISVKSATNTNIDGRTDTYRPIVPSKLVYAVDSVLCSTVEAEALTSTQQTSARSRLGAASASDVETISNNYISVGDESDVETVPEDVHDVRVNGTSIVENGVADIPHATNTDWGLFKVMGNSTNYGLAVSNNGNGVFVRCAPQINIDQRENNYMPIVPNNLDYAVKASLSDSNCKVTWTDAEKKAARNRIGVSGVTWELVNTIAVNEDTSSTILEFSADANGTPYNFEAIRIVVNAKAVAANGDVRYRVNTGASPYYQIRTVATADNNTIVTFDKRSGMWEVNGTYTADSANTGSTMYGTATFNEKLEVANITYLQMQILNSCTIASGSTIKIYAIKA